MDLLDRPIIDRGLSIDRLDAHMPLCLLIAYHINRI